MDNETTGGRHHVVVVGAGAAGLAAVRRLRDASVDVTVIDRANHHLSQPLLYQVATGLLSEGDVAAPIRDVLRGQRNATVLLGALEQVDLAARRLTIDTLGRRSEITYDTLILATGAQQSYFGHPGFARNAPGMKTVDDALALRGRIFGAFEIAETEPDPDARAAWLTVVIVGAGPTGVELAGQIGELARSMRGNFRRIDPAAARILLLDAGPAILAGYPASLQRRAERRLERLGVERHLGVRVTGVDASGIDTDSDDPRLRRIDAPTKIWAAGIEASPLGRAVAEQAGAGVDRAGRVVVEPDCTLRGHPEVFVVGDLMNRADAPAVERVATDSAAHVATTIVRRLGGDTGVRPYDYRERAKLATVARFEAVGTIGSVRVWGLAGWALWLLRHLAGVPGFKRRMAVLSHWTISLLTSARLQRTITERQVFGRRPADDAA